MLACITLVDSQKQSTHEAEFCRYLVINQSTEQIKCFFLNGDGKVKVETNVNLMVKLGDHESHEDSSSGDLECLYQISEESIL